ncbi:MAG: hypothetical protein HUJ74_00125 [Lachnospiraceae bacterium]|nr:hypothetical protein [Lachnospiraceae bacterium]
MFFQKQDGEIVVDILLSKEFRKVQAVFTETAQTIVVDEARYGKKDNM